MSKATRLIRDSAGWDSKLGLLIPGSIFFAPHSPFLQVSYVRGRLRHSTRRKNEKERKVMKN